MSNDSGSNATIVRLHSGDAATLASRAECDPAVDADRLGGDETAVVGEQQRAERCDVVGIAETGLDHLARPRLLDDSVGHRVLVELVVPDEPWRNGIGPNALGAVLARDVTH